LARAASNGQLLVYFADIRANVYAVDTATGQSIWRAAPVPCAKGDATCSPAQPAAVTAAPGVVFSGSLSGHIRAYSAVDGSIIWDFDTKRDYDGIGGVKGHGGALNGAGPVIADGMVYVNSGYHGLGVGAGNVLLAFGP
jgi:polyvinyl alcohol dehydrogenase (cytochrome)